MFVVETEACVCASEDSWVDTVGEFESLEEVEQFAQAGHWRGDVLRVYRGTCEIAYYGDYSRTLEFVGCPAIERAYRELSALSDYDALFFDGLPF